jgi:hypothetical protein
MGRNKVPTTGTKNYAEFLKASGSKFAQPTKLSSTELTQVTTPSLPLQPMISQL